MILNRDGVYFLLSRGQLSCDFTNFKVQNSIGYYTMKANNSIIDSCLSTPIVLEGGGFRGMYTAGILDRLLEQNMHFGYAVGVSAGAAYAVSYASRQHGRNLEVNRRFTADPRYFSFTNYIRKRTFFDWDFVYNEIPQQHVLFDYKAFSCSTTRLYIGITNCSSGHAEFCEGNGLSPDQFQALLSASSALPFLSQKIMIGGQHYMDGGISESIPIDQVFSAGYKRVVVVLTRKAGYRKKSSSLIPLMKAAYRRYPKLVEAFATRADRYNAMLDRLERLEKQGKVFVFRPIAPITVSRTENNPAKLEALYHTAQHEFDTLLPSFLTWLEGDVDTPD